MKPVLILAMLMSLLVVSCKKSNDEKILSDQLVAAQKVLKWLDAEKERADPDSAKLISLLIENLLPAELSQENNGDKIEITVPLKDQFKTANLTSLETRKYFVLTETAGKPSRGRVVELIMRERHKAVFRLPDANRQMPGFTGIISSLSVYGKFVSEDVYKNGKLYSSSRLISKAKTKKVSDGKKISETGIETDNLRLLTCLDWYIITTYYNNDGSVAYVTYEYVGTTCDGFPPPCATDRIITETKSSFRPGCADGGGDGGSGGGSGTNEVVTVQNIENLLTSPCFIQFVNSIGDAKLKSEISKLYQQTFVGSGNIFNVRYNEKVNLKDFRGNTVPAYSHIDPASTNTWVIELNSDFNTTGTKEVWGQVILHEVLHGFIKKNDLDFKGSSTWHQDHENMLFNWINQTRDALVELYNMPVYDALALSFQGLDDVLKNEVNDTFKQKMRQWVLSTYNIDLVAAEAIVNQYFSGTKGTPCQ